MNIQMRQLKVFKAIVDAGTVSEAANMLYLTQSSVSKTLASLEEEIGFQLFDRIGRRLKLSEQGRMFHKRIESAIETFEGVHLAADDIRDNQGRRLRVCAINPVIHSGLIPKALTAFAENHPDFRFSVDLVHRIEIEDWMVQRHSDLGFTLFPVEASQLSVRALTTVQLVVTLPRGHHLANRSSLSPADIANEHIIVPRSAVRMKGLVEAAFLDAGVELRPKTQTTSLISVAHLVANGLGVGIMDPFTASEVPREQIHIVPWVPETRLTYGAIWPRSHKLSSQEDEFIACVETVIKESLETLL